MDKALLVGEGEGRTDLVDESQSRIESQRTSFQYPFQTAAAHVTHHQESAIRFPPVIVKGDDVGMLQPSYHLRLRRKTADEVRLVGEAGADLLHRHGTADAGLPGVVDLTEGALTNHVS